MQTQVNIDSFSNDDDSQLSFNLFQDQGYCIIRNFTDESKIDYLKDKYSDKNNLKYYPSETDDYFKL